MKTIFLKSILSFTVVPLLCVDVYRARFCKAYDVQSSCTAALAPLRTEVVKEDPDITLLRHLFEDLILEERRHENEAVQTNVRYIYNQMKRKESRLAEAFFLMYVVYSAHGSTCDTLEELNSRYPKQIRFFLSYVDHRRENNTLISTLGQLLPTHMIKIPEGTGNFTDKGLIALCGPLYSEIRQHGRLRLQRENESDVTAFFYSTFFYPVIRDINNHKDIMPAVRPREPRPYGKNADAVIDAFETLWSGFMDKLGYHDAKTVATFTSTWPAQPGFGLYQALPSSREMGDTTIQYGADVERLLIEVCPSWKEGSLVAYSGYGIVLTAKTRAALRRARAVLVDALSGKDIGIGAASGTIEDLDTLEVFEMLQVPAPYGWKRRQTGYTAVRHGLQTLARLLDFYDILTERGIDEGARRQWYIDTVLVLYNESDIVSGRPGLADLRAVLDRLHHGTWIYDPYSDLSGYSKAEVQRAVTAAVTQTGRPVVIKAASLDDLVEVYREVQGIVKGHSYCIGIDPGQRNVHDALQACLLRLETHLQAVIADTAPFTEKSVRALGFARRAGRELVRYAILAGLDRRSEAFQAVQQIQRTLDALYEEYGMLRRYSQWLAASQKYIERLFASHEGLNRIALKCATISSEELGAVVHSSQRQYTGQVIQALMDESILGHDPDYGAYRVLRRPSFEELKELPNFYQYVRINDLRAMLNNRLPKPAGQELLLPDASASTSDLIRSYLVFLGFDKGHVTAVIEKEKSLMKELERESSLRFIRDAMIARSALRQYLSAMIKIRGIDIHAALDIELRTRISLETLMTGFSIGWARKIQALIPAGRSLISAAVPDTRPVLGYEEGMTPVIISLAHPVRRRYPGQGSIQVTTIDLTQRRQQVVQSALPLEAQPAPIDPETAVLFLLRSA